MRRIVGPIAQLGASNFAEGAITLQFYRRFLVIVNLDTVAHQFFLILKSLPGVNQAGLSFNPMIAPGETQSYPVEPFQTVGIDSPSSSVNYFYSDVEIVSHSTQKIAGNQTVLGIAGNGSLISAPGTLISGSVTLPIGTLVVYALGLTAYSASSTESCFLFLTGATTGNIYAVVGAGGNIASSFIMPVAEKLNVVFTNTTGVAQSVSYSLQATIP